LRAAVFWWITPLLTAVERPDRLGDAGLLLGALGRARRPSTADRTCERTARFRTRRRSFFGSLHCRLRVRHLGDSSVGDCGSSAAGVRRVRQTGVNHA
jgi:hypothetical protein